MTTESDFDRLLDARADDSETTRTKQLALLVIHTKQLRASIDALPDQIAAAVERGVKNAARDQELRKELWVDAYERISDHATNGISQWIGKRILMILVAGALSASIGWAVLTGRLK